MRPKDLAPPLRRTPRPARRLRVSAASLLGLGLVATSCASTGPEITLTPLVVLDTPPTTYVATIGGPDAALLHASYETSEGPSERVVQVFADVLEIERETLDRLVGWTNDDARVWTSPLQAVSEVLDHVDDEPGCERLTAPRLVVYDGQVGSVHVINEVAYVSHFDMIVEGPSMVADPTVDVARDGLALDLGVRVLPTGAIDLDVSLQLAHLERPFPEQQVHLPGSSGMATIQVPVAAVQRLTSRAIVTPDECLVLLAHLADDPDRLLLLFLQAQEARPEALEGEAVSLEDFLQGSADR